MTQERIGLRPGGLEWREVDGQIVALDLTRGVYVAVNESGAALWPTLAEGTTRAALVSVLTDRFGLGADAAASDVDAFLASLEGQGLLERR